MKITKKTVTEEEVDVQLPYFTKDGCCYNAILTIDRVIVVTPNIGSLATYKAEITIQDALSSEPSTKEEFEEALWQVKLVMENSLKSLDSVFAEINEEHRAPIDAALETIK